MSSADEVKGLIAASLAPALRVQGLANDLLPDDLDLRVAGLVDSLGFLRLISDLEQRLAVSIDLSEIDPTQLTCVGTLSRHVARCTVTG